MIKIGQNWGEIANYLPPNAQQRSAPPGVTQFNFICQAKLNDDNCVETRHFRWMV